VKGLRRSRRLSVGRTEGSAQSHRRSFGNELTCRKTPAVEESRSETSPRLKRASPARSHFGIPDRPFQKDDLDLLGTGPHSLHCIPVRTLLLSDAGRFFRGHWDRGVCCSRRAYRVRWGKDPASSLMLRPTFADLFSPLQCAASCGYLGRANDVEAARAAW
jgi:hypothetical protein